MEIRQAFPNEIGAIMTVIESARTALAEAGSFQWQGADGYPTEETIFDDVLKGQAYVGIIDGQIVSYAAVVTDGDPAYDKIYDGDWKHHNKRYITFHRIAVLTEVTGQRVAQTFIQGLIEELTLMIFVATRMKESCHAAYFGETWLCLLW